MTQQAFLRLLATGSGIRCVVALVAVAIVTLWLADGAPAEGGHAGPGTAGWWALQRPAHFAVSYQDEDKTAFREDEAGFSAYYRVAEREDAAGLPRLNVPAITAALLEAPEESNAEPARAGPGSPVDLGSNFSIVELPMHPALGFGNRLTPRSVRVYFDDRGWVVAYLPAGAPAASIWWHDHLADEPAGDRDDLEQNLLVFAINEALNAGKTHNPSLSTVSHGDVAYYDWQNGDCDAFLLFSSEVSGGAKASPVNFIIPPKIAEVQASAAVLITSRYSDDGGAVSASVVLGEQTIVTADAAAPSGVAAFDLERPTDENGDRRTSVHRMSVSVSGNDTAAGVVMLLYNKP